MMKVWRGVIVIYFFSYLPPKPVVNLYCRLFVRLLGKRIKQWFITNGLGWEGAEAPGYDG